MTLKLRAILLSLVALLASACQESRPTLVVLGVDGATWDVLDPMMAAGELPNFKRLVDGGVRARMMTVGPQVSPVVWTTFVTGQFGRRHGILDFTYPYTPGPKTPVQSDRRLEQAIWNLASDAGQRVGVVGYFVSHPAEAVNGVIVSDRAIQSLPDSIHPPDALADVQEQLLQVQKTAQRREAWSRFFPWPHRLRSDEGETPLELTEAQREASSLVAGRVADNILHSEYLRGVTRHLLENDRFDLLITYFRTIDFASHSLWMYFDDSDYEQKPDPELKALLGGVVPESYRYIDDVLGEILDRMAPEDSILIVSDHGFGSATGDYVIHGPNPHRLNGNHRPDGIFLGHGPAFASGEEVTGITILDIMPLMLKILGLPIAEDLPGNIPLEALSDAAADRKQDSVPHYPPRNVARTTGAEVDVAAEAEAVKSLQGLGYIGSDFELGNREEEFAYWQIPPNMLLEHAGGEMLYYVLRRQPAEALRLLQRASEQRPEIARLLPGYVRRLFGYLGDRFPPNQVPPERLQEFQALLDEQADG